jgi:hypothetical protein
MRQGFLVLLAEFSTIDDDHAVSGFKGHRCACPGRVLDLLSADVPERRDAPSA